MTGKKIMKTAICYKAQSPLSRLAIVLNVSSVILKAVTAVYFIHLEIKGATEALTAHQRGLFFRPSEKKNSLVKGNKM